MQTQTRKHRIMTKKRISALIDQAVQQSTKSVENSSAIATTQNTQLADLKLAGQGLFDESKALWKEFVEFDQEHQLTQRVGAQLWRLTQAVGKPILVLSLKGIQAAVVTVASSENRAALAERFSRSQPAQRAEASLDPLEE
jgi:hypothetical protein